MAIVLDTWALLAHQRDEPAAGLVREQWLDQGAAMCSVNLGEALCMEMRPLVRAAAGVKALGGLSYADAFCGATADVLDAQLLTGDSKIVDGADVLPCEVIDLRT